MYPISIDPATGTIRYIGIKDRLRVYRLAKLWQCPPSVVRQETYLDQEIALLNEQALNLFDRENSERIQKEMNSGSGSGSGSGGSKPGNKPTLEQGRQRDEARAAALLAD